MEKITTGIKDLDSLIDSAHIGDNMVWETEAGTSEDIFIQNFMALTASRQEKEKTTRHFLSSMKQSALIFRTS
ncbi:MAG: hypothetical protein H6Q92_2010 [Nitrospirae bacterium]|nr:hypothetical protein [Nitrospirota bacterium]